MDEGEGAQKKEKAEDQKNGDTKTEKQQPKSSAEDNSDDDSDDEDDLFKAADKPKPTLPSSEPPAVKQNITSE